MVFPGQAVVAMAVVVPWAGELEWTAPPSCPDRLEARALVDHHLSATPARPEGAAVTIRRDGERWKAEVRPAEGAAIRHLEASDCESLARAVALIIAMTVEASAPRVEAAPADASAPEEPPDRIPPAPSPSRGETPPSQAFGSDEEVEPPTRALEPEAVAELRPIRRRRQIQHGLGVGAGAGYGPLPAPQAVLEAGYRLAGSRWRIELGVIYGPPLRRAYPDEPRVGGRFQMAAGTARACWRPSAGVVGFPLCGGLEAGAVLGRGIGADTNRQGSGLWVVAVVRPGLEVALARRLDLRLGVEAMVPLFRSAFHVGDRDPLFRVPVVGVRGLAGLEVAVW